MKNGKDKIDFWRGTIEATLGNITDQIEKLPLVMEAAVARGLKSCSGGMDREARLRVLEHLATEFKTISNRTTENRTSFWLPLTCLLIGDVVGACITVWIIKG